MLLKESKESYNDQHLLIKILKFRKSGVIILLILKMDTGNWRFVHPETL
jgi:hypothetical protein